ncbi:MAG: DUF4336 domain-containing protein [Alphaproteobacteria bacterium HGW-Alphaproteobacteria-12]|nr:MAG: DUF4336 domain-containing protein [Alphaproteobacteria bacterium HGW-Alphaproteobacteria-12]
MFQVDPYEPIGTLKPLARDIWIVDGPVIGMKWLGLRLPFPTRMTIVRLADGGLWVHSPVAITQALKAEVDALGPVRFIVAPNKIHYWWVGEWRTAYPDAIAFATPRVEEKAGPHGISFDRELTDAPETNWAGEIDQVLVPGRFLTEAVFFHRASATLILTDLIENFEMKKVPGAFFRFVLRITGVAHPHGAMPKDLRATFAGHKQDVKRAVETMIGWAPARIVIAHGRCYEGNAVAELRRAFRWAGIRETAGSA